MDSRIREIEMRLARAKEGLGDGDRQDYLNQLYLLDAEIKAVIKANGFLPQAYAPKRRRKTARNALGPALQFGLSFGAVVVAASVTYAAFQVAGVGASTSQPVLAEAATSMPTTETIQASQPESAGGVPAMPDNQAEIESILIVSEPLVDEVLLADSAPAPEDGRVSLPAGNPGGGAAVATTLEAPATPEGLEVIAANFIPPMEDTPTYNASGTEAQGKVTTGVDASQVASDREGFDWTIARFTLPGQAKKVETEEVEVVNHLKESLSESAGSSE